LSRRLPIFALVAVVILAFGAALVTAIGGLDRSPSGAPGSSLVADASAIGGLGGVPSSAAGGSSGSSAPSAPSTLQPMAEPTPRPTPPPTALPSGTTASPGSTPAIGGSPSGVPASRIVPVPANKVRIVTNGSRAQHVVALTFDDGYSAVATIQILQVLLREKVAATFFPYGWAVHATSPAWHAVVQAGFPIGNHTLSHANLANLTPAQVTYQLVRGREAIDAWSGGTSVNLMRPPYGAYTKRDIAAIGAAGYGTIVLWDVDTLDWSGNSVSTIVSRAIRGTNGSIVLMHAGPMNTPKALPAIIAWYRAHGYRFVTVPELLGMPTR